MPLQLKGQPTPKPPPDRELISNATIYDCIAAPHPADIQLIHQTLLETPDVTSCLNTINTLKSNRGLALADILTALGDELGKMDVPAQTRVAWLQGLAEIEYRLSGGGSETLQTGGLVGVIRQGLLLWLSLPPSFRRFRRRRQEQIASRFLALFCPFSLPRRRTLWLACPLICLTGVDLMEHGGFK